MYVYHCKYKIYDFDMRIFRSLLSISLMLQVTRWAPPVPLVHHDGLKLRSHAARHPTRLTDLPKRGRDPKCGGQNLPTNFSRGITLMFVFHLGT